MILVQNSTITFSVLQGRETSRKGGYFQKGQFVRGSYREATSLAATFLAATFLEATVYVSFLESTS